MARVAPTRKHEWEEFQRGENDRIEGREKRPPSILRPVARNAYLRGWRYADKELVSTGVGVKDSERDA